MCRRITRCRRSERGDGDADDGRDGGVVGIDADRRADLRRTGVRAHSETPGGPGLRLRRVMEDVGEPRIEEELSWREALDEAHGAATAGTRP
jgi:hypothetical protein